MMYRISLALTLCILAFGCSPKQADSPAPSLAPEVTLGEKFAPSECGNLRVEATWTGERPNVPPFDEVSLSPQAGWVHRAVPNPHAPVIGPAGGVSRVVVFLRNVDPTRSKPWSLPEAKIVLRDTGIEVLQPEAASIGFVRRSGEVEIATESARLQSLRARGESFFTLMFPANSSPLRRRFSKDGFVELSSATGMFAPRGHLLVQPHPYCGTTDPNGSLPMDQIPEGEYELVCWLPNFRVDRIERDPETGIQVRQFYAPPVERTIPVRVEKGRTAVVPVSLSLSDFGSPKSEKGNP
jgi:hypothetical protein